MEKFMKLLTFLDDEINSFNLDYYNEFTYEWSKGYLKGLNHAKELMEAMFKLETIKNKNKDNMN